MSNHETTIELSRIVAWVGFFVGPALFLFCAFGLPLFSDPTVNNEQAVNVAQLTWQGRATLGLMCWMGTWWLTEAVGISVTAILPIVILPMANIATIDQACAPYADPIIYLYLGGFILAIAMEKWGLGKRLALHVLKLFGTSSNGMIAGFMIVTAAISAFVSNTATTAMMLPIALSVIQLATRQSENADVPQQPEDKKRWSAFTICLLLTVAHSSSIGGISTVVGTPTNALIVGYLEKTISDPFKYTFSFVSWLPIGGAFVILFLPVMYVLFTRFLFPLKGLTIPGGRELIEKELSLLGKLKRGEWITLTVFAITVTLWLFRPLVTQLELSVGGETIRPLAALSDPGIAMFGALLLLLIPVDLQERKFVVDWAAAEKIPWGILLLFGGGLSLAEAVQANGVAEFIGGQATALGDIPLILLIIFVGILTIVLSELASNTATAAALVPVLAAVAISMGIHPYLLVLPATVAASCGFMLPVATPPNAIIFGTGLINSRQMIRAGIWLNLVAVILLVVVTFLVIKPYFGI